MSKRLIYAVIAIVAVFAVVAVYKFMRPVTYQGALISPPQKMPDFTLESADGPVSLSQFQGKYVALFFGYTNCTDVCPLTMSYLAQTIKNLGNKAKRVQVIFVSVDYPRDTPTITSNYAKKFDPNFIGVTGSQAQIQKVTSDYYVSYSFGTPDANGDYEVNHTALVMLLDPQGRLVLTWNGNQPSDMTSDLTNFLAH